MVAVDTFRELLAKYVPRPQDAPTDLYAQRLSECGKCVHSVDQQCTAAGTLCSVLARRALPTCPLARWPDSSAPAIRPIRRDRPIYCVIPCHHYGQYLRQCVESVLAQTRPAERIVIVLDQPDEYDEQIAEEIREENIYLITVLETKSGRTSTARRVGMEECLRDDESRNGVFCFLDADDYLERTYFEEGLAALQPGVGIVTSPMLVEGDPTVPPRQVRHTECDIERRNWIHAGSLVTAEALLSAENAFPPTLDQTAHHDWHLFRAVLRAGWEVRWQHSVYCYRQHPVSQSREMERAKLPYWKTAALEHQPVTVFVPYSGRDSGLDVLCAISRQEWNTELFRYVICDTQEEYHVHRMREAIGGCSDLRNYKQRVGTPRLADAQRDDPANMLAVRRAMVQIYSRAIRECNTEYLWIVEDDVLPRPDTLARLMSLMDENTASVSAAYKSRFQNEYVAWDDAGHAFSLSRRPTVQAVGGNGFGCVLLRASVAKKHHFTCAAPHADYDPNFYQWLRTQNMRSIVDCGHVLPHGAEIADPSPELSTH